MQPINTDISWQMLANVHCTVECKQQTYDFVAKGVRQHSSLYL